MACLTWYLNSDYSSKEDCVSQMGKDKSLSGLVSTTEGFDFIETGDTKTSSMAFTTDESPKYEPEYHLPEYDSEDISEDDSPMIALLPAESDSEDDWNGNFETTMTSQLSTTEDVTVEMFTTEKTAEDIQTPATADTEHAAIHVEIGDFKLGLVISGTAVGLGLLIGGLIKIGNFISNRIDHGDGDEAERSDVPLTAMSPTAPTDSRLDDTTFNTAHESTIVDGMASGSFTPAFSPIRNSTSLPNVQDDSFLGRRSTIERTQSTIVFNLDDTVGEEFDALAQRNQQASINLSKLSNLRTTSQILNDADKKELGTDSNESGSSTGGSSDAGGSKRRSTRERKPFKPTQYGDL